MTGHLRTSLTYIKRAPFQAMAAVSVLALTFFVTTILAVLVYSSSKVLKYFETRPQVIAFLKSEATDAQVERLKQKLSADTRVKNLRYVSREEALEIYKKATSDNPLLGELVSPTIFPASLEFSLADLSYAGELINEIEGDASVSSVEFTARLRGKESVGDVVEKLKSVTYYLRLGGAGLAFSLIAASFLVLTVIIGMRVTTRREEVETLSLIGASSKFIRSPIVLEAVLYALLGVFIGWVAGFILVLYAAPLSLSYFREIPILPRETMYFFALFGAIFLAELLSGVLIAIIGSSLAISRALK